MSAATAKVPAILAVGIIGFAVGVGVGAFGLIFYGYQFVEKPVASPPLSGPDQAARAKGRLALLVVTLDRLMEKPLNVSLNDEERTKLREHLQGIEELEDEDANKKLGEIKKVLERHKDTLDAAGFPWDAQRGGGRRQAGPPASFLKSGDAAKHFKALQERLAPGK